MNQSKDNIEIILLSDPSQQLVHPFYNKQIVFTGSLSTMTRSEAAKKVQACGGMLQGAVTKDTDFVILGKNVCGISSKHLKAKQLISLGFDIQIMLEDDFIWVLSMPRDNNE
ncbi:BRCT domain-containing protein [Ureibacillus manganicus]|uniref:DNA polymerase III subunit epsilon n=1 Tax=Ureibacillus manganicus DSM 26584 TaxID=1384049 RepID=A0A0A3HZH6_9BACL|nr:BRCT domain-containing protein [Ureibacillus manganicus]KGR77996.1 DNA polymerase III subunit epsilon [Ureibacillus manganicus DSM 26584]